MRSRFRLSSALVLAVLALSPQLRGQDEEPGGAPRGLVFSGPGAFEGSTLFPPLRSTTTYLVDLQGEVVHTWPGEHTPGNSAYLLADGTLLRSARVDNERFEGGGQGGKLQLLDWNGEVMWDFDYSDERHMSHHDVEPLPNGNVLLIAWELSSREEAVAAGRDPDQIGEQGFWPDFVVEIEPVLPDGGNVVWEWHAVDHLIQDFDPEQAGYGDVTAHPERIDVNADHRDRPPMSVEDREAQEELERQMAALGYTGDDDEGGPPHGPPGRGPGRDRRAGDWLHTNGIDYHPELDLIALSVHNLNEIWILDHSTTTAEARGRTGGRWGHGGDLLARWGNPRTIGAEGEQRLFGQHDATFVPGEYGSLHVLVFNNGRGRPGGDASSADEIAFPFDPERGFGAAQAELVWTYQPQDQEGFFSAFISGAQRLPDGNTLLCLGVPGRFLEVTRAGEVVWDYLNPFGEQNGERGGPGPHGLFRGTRLASDDPGLRWGTLKASIRTEFPEVRQLPVRELAARADLPVLLDVREAREYEVSHLAGARRARTKSEALAALEGVPRDAEVVLYCSVGYRSSQLAQELAGAGYTNVANLEGSIFEWANAGHPVVQGDTEVDEVHPYDKKWGQLLHRELWSDF